jgi:hypothetical protein
MFAIEYGLGRFGDRRLEKGGLFCTPASLNGLARAFDGSGERGRERSRSHGGFAIPR